MIRPALGIALLLFCPGIGETAELTGIVIHIRQPHGQEAVRLEGPNPRLDPAPTLFRAIPRGAILQVPVGASVQVVCSTPSLVQIDGPASWRLEPRNCRLGKSLSMADYALVVPRGGRFQYARGLWLFEREVRLLEGQDPLAPVVLSPRNTLIRSLRPTLTWFRVPEAVEYRIEWSTLGADAFSVFLGADDIVCPVRQDGLEVCALPWPAQRPDLPPGRSFLLKVAARRNAVDRWHAKEGPIVVQTAEVDLATLVGQRLADVDRVGFEKTGREAARTGVLAGAGLFAEAIESCREAIDLASLSLLKVTLADLYLSTGLHGMAQALYGDILEDADPAARAAAAFGMGRIEYFRGRYFEASWRFRQALELYDKRAFPEERAFALSAAEKAKEHLPELR